MRGKRASPVLRGGLMFGSYSTCDVSRISPSLAS